MLPEIGLQHLLLSVGMAGSYGGQTSVTGTNIRTHMVGLYADKFEKPIASPYELLRELQGFESDDLISLKATLHEKLQSQHTVAIQGSDVEMWQQNLISEFNETGSQLEQAYKEAKPKIDDLFDRWFFDK